MLVLLVVAFLGTTCCGAREDPTPPQLPAWAKVAAAQLAEAHDRGIPVAFENALGMRFVLVPAGRFEMGSPVEEQDRESDEILHSVSITRPFYLSITEVTNGQYRRWRPTHESGRYDHHDLDGDDQPVMLPWEDAAGFAAWLGIQDTTHTYRLPTEAEWEYACRAGASSAFSFGNREEDLVRFGNFSDVNDPTGGERADLDDGHPVTAPVGRYAPNSWGLFDMHGNVWEWCADWYAPYPRASVRDPSGPQFGDVRVRRGGAWRWFPSFARCAYRRHYKYEAQMREDGFRVAAVPVDK